MPRGTLLSHACVSVDAMPRGTLLSHACVSVIRDSKMHFLIHWLNERLYDLLCYQYLCVPMTHVVQYVSWGCHCISYPPFDKVPVALYNSNPAHCQDFAVTVRAQCALGEGVSVVIHIGSCSNRYQPQAINDEALR